MPLLPSLIIQVVCHVFAPNDSRLTSHIIQRRSMQMQMQMQMQAPSPSHVEQFKHIAH